MLRSVTLSLALSLPAAACALVEPPPLGTELVEAEIRNPTTGKVKLEVFTSEGILAGGARPPSIPANATTRASFYVPVNEDWAIIIDGKAEDMLRRADLEQFIDPGCTTYIELGNDGFEYGCDGGS